MIKNQYMNVKEQEIINYLETKGIDYINIENESLISPIHNLLLYLKWSDDNKNEHIYCMYLAIVYYIQHAYTNSHYLLEKLLGTQYDPIIYYYLGCIYLTYEYEQKNKKLGIQYLNVSINLGNPAAMNKLGLEYLFENDVMCHEKAFDLLQNSIKYNYVPAFQNLAYMYHSGKYVKKDLNVAIYYYHKVCEPKNKNINDVINIKQNDIEWKSWLHKYWPNRITFYKQNIHDTIMTLLLISKCRHSSKYKYINCVIKGITMQILNYFTNNIFFDRNKFIDKHNFINVKKYFMDDIISTLLLISKNRKSSEYKYIDCMNKNIMLIIIKYFCMFNKQITKI